MINATTLGHAEPAPRSEQSGVVVFSSCELCKGARELVLKDRSGKKVVRPCLCVQRVLVTK